MDRNDYFHASKLNYEIEVNERQVEELTSWLESERFEGVARDVLEYTRKKINQVLRKQNQEFKNL